MIASFGNKVAREIWEKDSSKLVPKQLHQRAKALLTIMQNVSKLDDLKKLDEPPHLRLHKLKGDRKHQWSITIELPWCITFEYKEGEFLKVTIENYHKG